MQQNNEDVYVLGFAFIKNKVLLIHKTHPEEQKNEYNGLGGKVEDYDSFIYINKNKVENSLVAMVREFREESNINTSYNQWIKTGTLRIPKKESLIIIDVFVTEIENIDVLNILHFNTKNENEEYLILVSLEELEELYKQDKLVNSVYNILKSNSVIGYFTK